MYICICVYICIYTYVCMYVYILIQDLISEHTLLLIAMFL